MKIYKRLLRPIRQQSFFLFGPRGVGKSRLLRQLYPKAQIIDLLNDRTYRQYMADTDRLNTLVKALKDGDILIIDEIQKAPALLSNIHEIIESDQYPRIQFILTGSSSRKLKKSGVDLMAGRAIVRELCPFVLLEIGKDFKLARVLETGLVPLVWSSVDPVSTLQSYIGIYLKEEIRQEGLVRNLESFSRFLEVMCFCHGEILNLSNVARDASIKRSTVDGYLSILEDLLLGYRIQSFKIKNRKQTVESEKFYYFDIGVFKSLCPPDFQSGQNQFLGQSIEGLVAQHLKSLVAYRGKNEKLSFWHTKAGNEVDFVVYGPELFLAVEVKAAKEVKPDHLSGLISFGEDYPKANRILVYLGKESREIKGIRCLPIEKFLAELPFPKMS